MAAKEIYNKLIEHFTNKGYGRLSPDAEGAAPIFGIYDKTSLYLVRIVLPEMAETVSGKGKVLPGPNVQADKVVVLDLHIADRATIEKKVRSEYNETPDLTAKVIEVHWFIDADNRSLVIPKRQLRNVMGLERELTTLLKGEAMSYYHLHRRVDQPVVTYILMAVNVAYWLFLEWNGSSTDSVVLIKYGAMQRSLVLGQGQYWRMLTSMFMHIGATHLALNMFSLYIFGSRLEMYMRRWQYLTMYMMAGFAGAVMSLIGNGFLGNNPVSAGASGAIYGILGSVMVVSKLTKKSLDGVNAHMIWIIFVIGIIYAVINPAIGGFAHAGGFLAGVIVTLFVMSENKLENG